MKKVVSGVVMALTLVAFAGSLCMAGDAVKKLGTVKSINTASSTIVFLPKNATEEVTIELSKKDMAMVDRVFNKMSKEGKTMNLMVEYTNDGSKNVATKVMPPMPEPGSKPKKDQGTTTTTAPKTDTGAATAQ